MKIKSLLAVASLPLLLAGCSGKSNNYSEYVNLPSAGWAYNDTLVYPLRLTDSIVEGRLHIAVDHGPLYRYNNLWLEVTYGTVGADSASATTARDTLKILMTDSTGNWRGTGMASSYQVESDPLEVTIDSRSPITVRHILRTDTLRNISRVGLFFISSEEN